MSEKSLKSYRIDLSYNGTNFNGWQAQPDKGSVQDCVENALATIFGRPFRITGAARTDSGVHALHQVACFRHEDVLDVYKLRASLQALIPETVGIYKIKECEQNFHPIESAKAKIYRYRLWRHPSRHPFLEPMVWRVQSDIDYALMRSSSEVLVGTHDFSSFCASDSNAKTRQRKILAINWVDKGALIEFWIHGEGFLKQMVRAIIGTIVGVGLGKFPDQNLSNIIEAKNRSAAGKTAPANGLCLVRIQYDEIESLEMVVDSLRDELAVDTTM